MTEVTDNLEAILPKLAKITILSPPAVAREWSIPVADAQQVLQKLEFKNFIKQTGEGGIVPIYEVTKEGYDAVESLRQTSLFSRLLKGSGA